MAIILLAGMIDKRHKTTNTIKDRTGRLEHPGAIILHTDIVFFVFKEIIRLAIHTNITVSPP